MTSQPETRNLETQTPNPETRNAESRSILEALQKVKATGDDAKKVSPPTPQPKPRNQCLENHVIPSDPHSHSLITSCVRIPNPHFPITKP